MNEYILLFYSPLTNKIVFLDESADIKAICYSNNPKLPGTNNILRAKRYKDQDSAKKDVFDLRYYHREFIQINVIIIPYNKALKLFGVKSLDTFKSFAELEENFNNIN